MNQIIILIILISIILLILFLFKIINKENYSETSIIYYDENDKIIDHNYFEKTEQEMANKYIKPDDVVLELGARYGTVSCAINKILNNKKNQVVIEPDNTVWNALEKNRKNNNCEFNIVKGFISNKKLGINKNGYGTMGKEDELSDIKCYTLDEISSLYNLKFNVLVVDCEGCLCQFFNENEKILEDINLILFEADQTHVCDYDNVRQLLIKYKFMEIEGPGHQNAWKKESRI
jgi:FkbM family methyltransferase